MKEINKTGYGAGVKHIQGVGVGVGIEEIRKQSIELLEED